jgi:hypothetical protein
MHNTVFMKRRIAIGAVLAGVVLVVGGGCSAGADGACSDDDGAAVDCEVVTDDSALTAGAGSSGANAPVDSSRAAAIAWGDTDRAELRKFLPIGRTSGVTRFVVMRLRPSDLPRLAIGDTLRAAAELQITTACDIGQVGPSCGYAPHVRMQLLLSGNPNATEAKGPGTIALSDATKFDCTPNEHHCVKTIDFAEATRALQSGSAPACVKDNSCSVNVVAWAYHGDARGGGQDKLLLGANEGDFLQNGNIEQDRGRVMAVRERDLKATSVALEETSHNVKSGPIDLASDGHGRAIYSHPLNGGRDLKAGEKYRLWADVEASSNHRVNLSLEMFLTKNRGDDDGGKVDNTSPSAISEHSGTNCSPGSDCHLRKVAVFQVDRDIAGPVFINISASTEVPGPGSATTTIHDSGFIKAVRYTP